MSAHARSLLVHTNSKAADVHAARQRALMRLHFWGALIATPFAFIAALTGLFYLVAPSVDSYQHASLDRVAVSGTRQSLDAMVMAAKAAAPPDAKLRNALLTPDATASVRFTFAAPIKAVPDAATHDHAPKKAANTWVYVNPYSATVLGQLKDDERFIEWSKKLHSAVLQGDGWRWLIELAASWVLVMLITGVFLWWPSKANAAANARKSGWRRWHPWVGVALSVMTLTILLTGLTWSKYAGPQSRVLRDTLGQASAQMPKDFKLAAINAATVVSDGAAIAPLVPLNWQQILNSVKDAAPHQLLYLSPPPKTGGVWQVRAAMPGAPAESFELAIDGISGAALHRLDWTGQTVWGKATAVGSPFHRGDFGLWNQALLALFGAGVLFSLITGWVMVWKRWRTGLPALPRAFGRDWRRLPLPLWALAPGLLWLMPLLPISAPLVALVEIALSLRESAIQSES